MEILICSDSFKHSVSSLEAASILASHIQHPCNVLACADGGEGSLDALKRTDPNLLEIHVDSVDALFRLRKTTYLFDESKKTAYIELASICGIQSLQVEERNPMHTSSYGLGIVIQHAIECHAKEIYLFIGSSATNDAACGMAEALGFQFFDTNQIQLNRITGKKLVKIGEILKSEQTEKLADVNFYCICDVNNPLYGPEGAAYTYAKQKGANEAEIHKLDKGLQNFASLFQKEKLNQIKGAGSAGGIGAGTVAFLSAQLIPGATFMSQFCNFEQQVEKADIIITGEGCIDQQSFHGKWVFHVLETAKKHNKPVIGICAIQEVSLHEMNQLRFLQIYSLYEKPPKLINLDDTHTRLRYVAQKINTHINTLNH